MLKAGDQIKIKYTGFKVSGPVKSGDVLFITEITYNFEEYPYFKIKLSDGSYGYGSKNPECGDSIEKCFKLINQEPNYEIY